MVEVDWDDVRFFVAAARAGSLARASRRLRVSVATVSRRMDRLEEALGRRLFHRHAGGLQLTEAGQALAVRAEGVAERMADFMRAAAGATGEECGVVVVSTLETLATHVIAPTMGEFRLAHPRVEVMLRGEANIVSLAERKADIALRIVRPTEERVVGRRVGVVTHGLYASPEYLERRGRPADPQASLAGHDLVAYDPRYDAAPEAAWVNLRADGARFALRATTAAALVRAVEAGVGLGVLPVVVAPPGLVQLVGPEDLPQRDVWLVVHEDLKDAPHVRAVADHLVEVMRRAQARGAPTGPREESAPSEPQ